MKTKGKKEAGIPLFLVLVITVSLVQCAEHRTKSTEAAEGKCDSEQHGEFTLATSEDGGAYYRHEVVLDVPFCSDPVIVATEQTSNAELSVERVSVQSVLLDRFVVSLEIDTTMTGPGGDVVVGWVGRSEQQ